jgi:RNA polymerase sigma-70 factor, ECF subfamily
MSGLSHRRTGEWRRDKAGMGLAGTEDKEAGGLSLEEGRLLHAVRAGDEAAFSILVETHNDLMMRVALLYAPSRPVAEEIVQEAWLGVLKGLERFEGRSSLKTWIFSILKYVAMTGADREGRTVPFSSLESDQAEDETSVGPEHFVGPGDRWEGHWISAPRRWGDLPENQVLFRAALAVAEKSISELPPNQRAAIMLRDIEGWNAKDVCDLLDITETNQRVLLHRARSKVRRALDQYFNPPESV